MKSFACKDYGFDCSWRHIARTGDLLTDMVVLHFRDAHGVKEALPETLTKIRNAFTDVSSVEAAKASDLRVKQYQCSLAAGCTFKYIAQTEELLVDGVAVHAREAHGIREFPPELIAKVKKEAIPWLGPAERAA